MSLPKVSVVTPSYQQGRFIEQTLLSVCGQGYQNIEHIVVDGASTDGTHGILAKYGSLYNLRWISERDSGQTEALNKGFRIATGDIVGWVNSDDTYLPGAVARVVEFFASMPEIGWVYGDAYWMDQAGNATGLFRGAEFELERLVYEGMYFPQPTVFARRSLIEMIGGLDETINTAMDYDYCLRLGLRGRAVYISQVLATRRLHADAKSIKSRPSFYEDSLACLDRLFELGTLPPNILRIKEAAYSNRHRVGGYYLFSDRQYQAATRALIKALMGKNSFGPYQLLSIGAVLLQSALHIDWIQPGLSRRRMNWRTADSHASLNVSWSGH